MEMSVFMSRQIDLDSIDVDGVELEDFGLLSMFLDHFVEALADLKVKFMIK